MGLETKTKAINGHEWSVTQWPARHALRMKIRLAKTIGPALGRAAKGGSLDTDISDLDLGGIVDALVERLDESGVESLVMDMLHQSLVDNQDVSRPAIFDQHFAGNFGELYKGLAFILEVNFGSFLDGLAGIITPPAKQQDDYRSVPKPPAGR